MKKRIVCVVLMIILMFLMSACSTVTRNGVSNSSSSVNANASDTGINESNVESENTTNSDIDAEDEVDFIQPVSFFDSYAMIMMIVVLVMIFYFFMIRPERKKKKKLAEMRNSTSVGDEIVTIEGIMGKVVFVDDENTIIETGEEKARIQIAKWAISSSSAVVPETPKNIKKTVLGIVVGSVVVIALTLLIVFQLIMPMNQYNRALLHFNDGQYIEALATLEESSPDYMDSNKLRHYFSAYITFERGEYELATDQFDALGAFRKSEKMRDESNYLFAHELLDSGKFDEAYNIFDSLSGYKNSEELMLETRYRQAVILMESDGARAKEIFDLLGDYKDSALLLMNSEVE